MRNKKVLSLLNNYPYESFSSQRWTGREFQAVGPAMLKERKFIGPLILSSIRYHVSLKVKEVFLYSTTLV